MTDTTKKFVYVDPEGGKNMLREFDPATGEGPVLEECRDHVLIEASESVEDGPTQGVVRAYLGGDQHWHFDGRLTRDERKALSLWADTSERDLWAAEARAARKGKKS